MRARRVLITGLANFWGGELARLLAHLPEIEQVVGVDNRPPARPLPARVEYIEADLRSPALAPLIHATGVDTIVHNDILQFPEPGRSERQLHDVTVIGTLGLLSACDSLSTLRTLVVRGSAAIYGSEAAAPDFFTEDLARRYPLRTRFQRDIGELERLFETFARRHPSVTCTMLRMQPVIGTRLDNPITRMFRMPVVPTHLGFDPRMQFLHEDDSVVALAAAISRPVHGPVNVAGEGTVSLTRTLRRLRRPSLPIPHPLYGTVAGTLARAGGVALSEDTARYLRYGRGVDIRRLVEEVGFRPTHTTAQAIERVAAGMQASDPATPPVAAGTADQAAA